MRRCLLITFCLCCHFTLSSQDIPGVIQNIFADKHYQLSGEVRDVSSHNPLLEPIIPYQPKHFAAYYDRESIRGLGSGKADQLRILLDHRIPLILQGTANELSGLLDLPVSEEADRNPTKLMAVYHKLNGSCSYLFLSTSDKWSKTRFTSGETGVEPEQAADEMGQMVPVELSPVQNQVLLTMAEEWVAEQYYNENARVLSTNEVSDNGSWNSISDFTISDAAFDGDDTISIFTLRLDAFKIRDLKSEKDFYLVHSSTSHNVNVNVNYSQNFKLIGTGYVGWYVKLRDYTITANGKSSLLEYGPSGTINSGTTEISLGADLSVDKDGPGLGINAGYDHSIDYTDVTVKDLSSIENKKASWSETFACPANAKNYQLWPSVTWPVNTSQSTFFSDPVAIFTTTDIARGIYLSLDYSGEVLKDKIVGKFFSVEIERSGY